MASTNPAGNSNVVPVSEYTSALGRHLSAILTATIVGAVLGLLLTQVRAGTYDAEARVEVRPLLAVGDDPNLDINRQVNTTNERIIASSQRVTERGLALLRAAEELRVPGLDEPEVEALAVTVEVNPDDVLLAADLIEVSVPDDSQILVFSVSAGTAERARDLANASAHAYLDFREESGLLTTEQSRLQLLERESELIAELDALSGQVADAGEDAALLRSLGYREVSKRQELQGIGAKLANLNAISIDPGVILDRADTPDSLSGIPLPLGLIGGGLVGLLAGAALAYALDRRDDRFRDVGRELASMGVAVLGDVPVGAGLFRRGGEAGLAQVNSSRGEAYRRVQGSLLFQLDQSDKSIVLVAGTNNPQSATTVAANMAAAAARSGRRTLIVGADMRRPSLHDRFGAVNSIGLSDVLSRRATLEQVVVSHPDVAGLAMIFAGSTVDEPSKLLQSQALGELIDSVRAHYDLVVVEAPPVLQVADASDLARICEGAVVVIEPSRSTRRDASEAIEQLRRVGADVIGTVVAENDPA
jgi:capsular exopolysaccharide synthesis family protein